MNYTEFYSIASGGDFDGDERDRSRLLKKVKALESRLRRLRRGILKEYRLARVSESRGRLGDLLVADGDAIRKALRDEQK